MLDIKIVKLKTEEEIIALWNDKEKVVVSMICATYNQELYIEDAITGLLMQETDFAFEIIIHDDASTDSTAEIVRKYQITYPKIIKPIYQTENQYQKGIRPINFTLPAAHGKYICICEGDDYWVDPFKVALQVDFLQNNNEYSLHVFDCYEENEGQVGNATSKLQRLSIRDGSYLKDEMKFSFVLLPLTSCFKNCFRLPFERYFNKSINGDKLLQMILSTNGKAYVDNKRKVAVYRIHDFGIWSKTSDEHRFYEEMHTSLVRSQYFSDQDEISRKILFTIVWRIIKRIVKVNFVYGILRNALKKLSRLRTLFFGKNDC